MQLERTPFKLAAVQAQHIRKELDRPRCRSDVPGQAALRAIFQVQQMATAGVTDVRPVHHLPGNDIPRVGGDRIDRRSGLTLGLSWWGHG